MRNNDNNQQQERSYSKYYSEQIHARGQNESVGTKFKRDSQLLFRLCKFLLPGFPYGRILYEFVLTIVTTNKVNSWCGTISKEQAAREQH